MFLFHSAGIYLTTKKLVININVVLIEHSQYRRSWRERSSPMPVVSPITASLYSLIALPLLGMWACSPASSSPAHSPPPGKFRQLDLLDRIDAEPSRPW